MESEAIREDLLNEIDSLISRKKPIRAYHLLGRYGKKYTEAEMIAELKAMRDEGILYIMPSRESDELFENDIVERHSENEGQDTGEDVEDWLRHLSQLEDSDR